MQPFVSFPSLELYADVEARLTYQGRTGAGVWGAKIKLHGQNMSVVVDPDGSVRAQSHHQPLDASDTSGFFPFLERTRAAWSRAATLFADAWPIVFFGEWAGPGLQKGASVCRIDRPRFFLFAVGLGTMPHPQNAAKTLPASMITDPAAIQGFLDATGLGVPDVYVLPWMGRYAFDHATPQAVAAELDRLNGDVDALETHDPYVLATFGVDGPGEGYVLTPIAASPGDLDGATYGRMSFKAKTAAHRVRKQGKPAAPKAPPPEGLPAFLDTYVTPARCEQGLAQACGGVADKARTGAFVAWMAADVVKESARDAEALGLTPESVSRAVAPVARAWFLARCSG